MCLVDPTLIQCKRRDETAKPHGSLPFIPLPPLPSLASLPFLRQTIIPHPVTQPGRRRSLSAPQIPPITSRHAASHARVLLFLASFFPSLLPGAERGIRIWGLLSVLCVPRRRRGGGREMGYIGHHGVATLRRYKYSGVDHSLVAKYILQPFWSRFVIIFPLWFP